MLLCDEELAAMVKNGDGAAFDVLMERFMPYLRFKSRVYFCAGIESDDLLQEARIGLYIACVNYNKSRNTLFSTFAQLCISRRINSAKRRAFSMKNSMLNEYLPIYCLLYTSNETYRYKQYSFGGDEESGNKQKPCLFMRYY